MGQGDQQPLWHDDIQDATRTCIAVLGGPKRVGAMLWPETTADQAAQRLNRSLDDDRREVLHIHQYLLIWREARKQGCLAGVAYVNSECDCAPPIPTDPEDERDRVQRLFVESVKQQQALIERMEQLAERAKPSVVRRAV
jgi:hypothetical protein